MENKTNLPLYFQNMKELEYKIIRAIEGFEKVSVSSKHKSNIYSSDYYIPISVWDLQSIIETL